MMPRLARSSDRVSKMTGILCQKTSVYLLLSDYKINLNELSFENDDRHLIGQRRLNTVDLSELIKNNYKY